MTKIAIIGPSGRMGKMVIECAGQHPGVEISSAIDHPDSDLIGTTVADGVTVTSDLEKALADADVYIDFSTPESTAAAADAARRTSTAAVVGTTGLTHQARSQLDSLAEVAPALIAANFSLGVNLLLELAETAARALPAYDLEIVELHHRRKRDAPSGTALALGRALANGRGVDFEKARRDGRSGDIGPRGEGELGIAAIRGGDIVGDHTAYLIGDVERLELTHRASSRSVFADGALTAARWLSGRTPGLYTMKDVLGL